MAQRGPVAVLALTLCAAISLAAATPASALTRERAAKRALVALGSGDAAGRVVVLGLRRPLRAGTRVTLAGSRRPLATVGRGGAFFFYEDRAPSRPYPHPGRVALVSVRSGRVTLTRTIVRRPRVNGRVPAFLRSARAYRSARYRVFDGDGVLESDVPVDDPLAPTPTAAPSPLPVDPLAPPASAVSPNSPPKADSQTVTVKEGFAKRITLTGADDDGDLLTFHVTKPPLRGVLSGQPPDVVYTPPAGFLGPDHFAFKANDGEADSNTAQIVIDVVPLGMPPTVTASDGCTAYTEQGAAVVVDGQLGVSDADDLVLDSARVRFADGFQQGDNLLFTDQNGITGSYEEDTGVLSLFGTSSVANYQAALSSVRYENAGNGNAAATKDVEFVVNDAGNDSAPATKQICVTGGAGGANNPPTGETGEGALLYVENDGPVPADASFVAGDPDSANLSGATVKFVPVVSQPVDEEGNPVGPPTTTVTFAPAEDELAFADQNGIAGQYDDTTGVLTLTGTASLANYEAAIRSVTYENTSENPSDALRRLQFQVTDSAGANSTPSRRDVFVTPVNDAPVATASSGSTAYTGTATAIDPGLTALDVDDANLEGARVRIVSGSEAGDALQFADQLGISGSYDEETGALILTGTAPVADYQAALRSVELAHTGGDPSGERTVELTVSDGDLESDPTTKHVEVNDEPALAATGDALSYSEGDGPVAVDPGIAATDPDSPQLAAATVAIAGNFAPGEDELAFTDQNGIAGQYDDTTGVLTLTGSAPVADYEAALRSVTYENASDAPSTATRTITFQVDDGAAYRNLSNTASRHVTVTPVNDAPQVAASAGSASYTEGDPPTAIDAGATVGDVDDANLEGAVVRIASGLQDGDALSLADQPSIAGAYDAETGVLTLSGTASVAEYEAALRSVAYRHAGDDPSASRTVEFQVSDGDLDSAAASREVAIAAVNDKPALLATDGAVASAEGDGPVAVDPGIAAADPDSTHFAGATVTISGGFAAAEDELAFADQNGIAGDYDEATGVLTLTGSATVADYEAALRSVTYDNGSDDPSAATRTVTFQVDDGAAADNLSDAVARDVTVTPVNDAPQVATSAGSTSYTIGDPAAAIDAAVTVADADDANLESAEVRMASGFDASDELVFTDQLGIAGAYDAETGVLTLTGTAPVADYETALRSVSYRSTGEGAAGSRTVELKVGDGDADSAAALKLLDVASPPA